MNSKKYNNTKIFFSVAKGIATFLLIFIFVSSGLSLALQQYLAIYVQNQYLLFIAFIFSAGAAFSIIFFPINYYTDFYLEHKYNLSNQTFIKWIWEGIKALLVSIIISVPILLLFFFVLNRYGNLWWLPFAIGLFIISVILARILPVLILPLFYKITPIEDTELKTKIQNLAKDAGIKVGNVYRFNMSKNTKKANAAFTGLGKSKRILLGDNLIEQYTNDEIETVIAHELGHYKRKHIIKNIAIGTAASFLTFFLISYFYSHSILWFNFSSIKEIAALPLLILWMLLIGLVQTPLTNILSRRFEYEADEYAISSTKKTLAFISTLEKLTKQNLGDIAPHPLIEWFFYSHPSIGRRIDAIKRYSKSLKLDEEIIKDNLTFQGE